jgi:hypothetical protein
MVGMATPPIDELNIVMPTTHASLPHVVCPPSDIPSNPQNIIAKPNMGRHWYLITRGVTEGDSSQFLTR